MAATGCVMVACVAARRAGQEPCVTRRPVIHSAARMECVRRASVSVTRAGLESTAILVSGSRTRDYYVCGTVAEKNCANHYTVFQNILILIKMVADMLFISFLD